MVHRDWLIEQQAPPKTKIAIDESVGGQRSIDLFIESVLEWVQEKFGDEQFIKAKEEFYWKNGKVFHDDIFFHNRMVYFVDSFIFKRPLETSNSEFSNKTPFQAYCASKELDKKILVYSQLSVYQLLRIKEKEVVIRDLFSGKKLSVSVPSKPKCSGLQRGDYIQGFVYFSENLAILSRGLILHPTKVGRIIKSKVKEISKSDEYEHLRTLALFARQQLKHLRHKHVDPAIIYQQNP